MQEGNIRVAGRPRVNVPLVAVLVAAAGAFAARGTVRQVGEVASIIILWTASYGGLKVILAGWSRFSTRDVSFNEALDLVGHGTVGEGIVAVPELLDPSTLRIQTERREQVFRFTKQRDLSALVEHLASGPLVSADAFEAVLLQPEQARRLAAVRRLVVVGLGVCGAVACVGDFIDSSIWRGIGVGAIFVGIAIVALGASIAARMGDGWSRLSVRKPFAHPVWSRVNGMSLPRATLEMGLSSGHLVVVRASGHVLRSALVDIWFALVATGTSTDRVLEEPNAAHSLDRDGLVAKAAATDGAGRG